MGADIHTYVEYGKPGADGAVSHWIGFTKNGGRRDYLMFGILAGVRIPEARMFEPRGIPAGLSFNASDDYWLSVAPPEHPEWADGDGWVSPENAERWVKEGSSVEGGRRADGSLMRVSGPDWHSHSWLTADELQAAIDRYPVEMKERWNQDGGRPDPEWPAMVAAMRVFEQQSYAARVVFWFDN